MKHHGKRWFGILLSLVLILGMMPGMSLTAYADNPYTGAAKIHCSGTRHNDYTGNDTSLDVTLRKAALPSTCSLGEAVDTLWGWDNGNITSATVSGGKNVSIDKSNVSVQSSHFKV